MPRLALISAVPAEILPLVRRLRAQRLPFGNGLAWRSGETWLVAGGMGRNRAAAATRELIQTHRIETVWVVGVAGAIDPALPIGQLLNAERVLLEGEWLTPPVRLDLPRAVTASLLSLDHVVVTAAEKRELWTRHRGHGVEMETAGVVAALEGRPWAAVRAVSDTADDSLPLDFNRLRTPDGDLPTPRVAAGALRNPRSIPGLIRLGQNTSHCAHRLADAFAPLLVK